MPAWTRKAADWIHAWQAARDARKIADRFPGLDSWNALPESLRIELEDAHRDYVATVSTPEMAISWESCRLLASLAALLRPKRILDLGSGFSSYLLRRFAASELPDAAVCSVDDNAYWLERTQQFLQSKGLGAGELHVWSNFALLRPQPFDLIFHDLGSIPVRAKTLPAVLRMRAADGVVVLDDVHKRAYRPLAVSTVRKAGLEYLSAGQLTHDAFGRSAALVVGRAA